MSASLDRIILKCTQKKPERRYQNAYELIADLRHALVDPNDDFLKKEPEFDENSPTVVRGAEELNRQMEAQRNRNLEQTMEHPAVSEKTGPVPTENERGEVVWKEPEQPEKEIEGWQEEETDVYEEETSRRPDRRRKGRRIEEDSEDVNPQMERLLTMIGIGAAVLIVVVVIVIAAKLTGIFNLGSGSQKHPKTTVEASSEASESESLESTECRVPSLDGMTEDKAKTALEKQSLKIRYEYAKSETSEKGKVIGQSIASGTVVSKQTEVIVTIGEGNEAIDLTKLGLEEMSGEDAETLLAEENKLTVVVQKESSDTVASGIVIRYSPSSVDPGGTVTLYVSTGPNVPTVPMPRITGLSEENAKVVLEAVGLELGERKEAKSSEVAKGKIISQDVLEKTDTPEGSAIGYTVSLGKGTRYVAAINDEFQMSELFGPSSGDTHIRVSIVMKQTIAGNTVTKTVMEPREIGGDITLPIHYNIEGADGVQTGELQILDLTNDRVLKTYQLEFVEVSDN
ncbi:PASTA domain-containing protein [Clostridium fessum]|uniref:PASTA domain-containing protein n=1 Tax=Clostridium fessum TaxID=2126740 RepID=UPI0039A257E6